jgi:hypothetical protein
MEVLRNDQLDAVSGGLFWWGVLIFAYLNLEKLEDSYYGLVDGFNAGYGSANPSPDGLCTL